MRKVSLTPHSCFLLSLALHKLSHEFTNLFYSFFCVNNKSAMRQNLCCAISREGQKSNKNFENTRECVAVYDKKKRDNFHCYWKFNVPEVCRSTRNDTRRAKKKLSVEEWMNFFFLYFLILFFALVDDNVGWYLEHERNIYKLFPFISISIPFIMWQVSASFLFRTTKTGWKRRRKSFWKFKALPALFYFWFLLSFLKIY